MDALEPYMTSRPQAKPGKTCDADKPCDIVLEGGAASGIVYPRAIAELSKGSRKRSTVIARCLERKTFLS
jgi:hypothetical protein